MEFPFWYFFFNNEEINMDSKKVIVKMIVSKSSNRKSRNGNSERFKLGKRDLSSVLNWTLISKYRYILDQS